jgi:rubredoxin
MRTIIWYLRSMFCKHEFSIEEGYLDSGICGQGTRIYMRCKKCGFHMKHWKFI